jgi:hypothetical protein
VDGQRANGFDSDFFLIANISQSYHLAIVKCEVSNQIGKSEETETLQVRCKRLFLLASSPALCTTINTAAPPPLAVTIPVRFLLKIRDILA